MGNEILPGAEMTRADFKEVWGGALQGGILRAKRSNSLLLYSEPGRGEQFGYYDGWLPDDGDGPVFEYTGAGPDDQVMLRGNRLIRDYRAIGLTLRVLVACGGKHQSPQVFRYLGEFDLDDAEPVYEHETPLPGGGTRVAFVFRLRPRPGAIVEGAKSPLPATASSIERWAPLGQLSRGPSVHEGATASRRIAPEHNTRIDSTRNATGAVAVKRREAELCTRFEAFLRSQGHEVCRYEIRVKGDPGIMRTDTCDETDLILYEAKGDSSRKHVRDAIAQLADYKRHVAPKRRHCAVLLPAEPSDDLIDLIESQGFSLVYEQAGVFIGWPVTAV